LSGKRKERHWKFENGEEEKEEKWWKKRRGQIE